MTKQIIKKLKRFGADTKGVTMLEYGFIAAVIFAVCAVTVTSIGTNLETKFTNVLTALTK
jgi:Flp pilus assembly pilin Flp